MAHTAPLNSLFSFHQQNGLFSKAFWSRTSLSAGAALGEIPAKIWEIYRYRMWAPLCPGTFTCADTVAGEIFKRTLYGLGACLGLYGALSFPWIVGIGGVGLGLGNLGLKALGFALQERGFSHVRGEVLACPIPGGAIRIASLNCCGIFGGMSLDHGGVLPWKDRMDALIGQIQRANADILCLQEIYDISLGERLVARLKSSYAHFFLHSGPNCPGNHAGVAVFSKFAVQSCAFLSFANNDWSLNRGALFLKILPFAGSPHPAARVIATHLAHGRDDAPRLAQMEEIRSVLPPDALPTVIAGDLNVDRRGSHGASMQQKLEEDPFSSGNPPITCTNRMTAEWTGKDEGPEESIDYIAFLRGKKHAAELQDAVLIPSFEENGNGSIQTQTARSDHHMIAATLKVNP